MDSIGATVRDRRTGQVHVGQSTECSQIQADIVTQCSRISLDLFSGSCQEVQVHGSRSTEISLPKVGHFQSYLHDAASHKAQTKRYELIIFILLREN
jgi:hypothetical protein